MASHKPKEIYIALMGLTGSGKSSFINHCTKHQVVVGDGLQACTETVEVFSFEYSPGITIHLVDTPGFDDTNRQDSAVLREISAWLSESYTEQILLNGILYLHRISDPRMQGSGRMSIHLLRKLCGRDAFKNVVLVITMWELVETEVGSRREKELEETEEFWGFMKRHGSQIRRHHNTEESAREILGMFVPEDTEIQPEIVALAIQKELADEHKTLDQTSAGQLLDCAWTEEKENFQREIDEVRDALKTANEEKDHKMAKLLEDHQKEMDMNVQNTIMKQEKLRVTMEELHWESLAKHQKMLDEQTEVSRELSRELEQKAKLQDEEREKYQALRLQQDEKFQEQQTAICELQNRLTKSDPSPSISNTSETKAVSENRQCYNITGIPYTITSLLFSSDGHTLFIGTKKKEIWVYVLGLRNKWHCAQLLSCGSSLSGITWRNTVDALIRSNDDSYLIAVCGKKLIRFELDLSDNRYKRDDERTLAIPRNILALSPDNEYLLTGEVGGFILEILQPKFGSCGNRMEELSWHIMSDREFDVKGGISCIEFRSDGYFAIGSDQGYIHLYEIVDSTGWIESRGGFGLSGKVLSLARLSDMRLLIGTDEGLFIANSEGTIDQIGKESVPFDQCWLSIADGFYGTWTGHAHHFKEEGDRLIPIKGNSPVGISYAQSDVSPQHTRTRQLASAGDGYVRVITDSWVLN